MSSTKPKMTLQVKKRTASQGLLDDEVESFGNQSETEIKKVIVKPKAPDTLVKRVIRDSFSMPEDDYSLIDSLKDRALDNKMAVTKAEVLRAGLKVLNALGDAEMKKAFESLEKVKTGRPKV